MLDSRVQISKFLPYNAKLDANSRLVELQDEYTSRMKGAKDRKAEAQKPDMQQMLEEIRQLQEECLAHSRSKVDVATQNFDIVSICKLMWEKLNF